MEMRTKSPDYDWLTAKQTDVTGPLSRRSWGGTRDKPKNVCIGNYLEPPLPIIPFDIAIFK